MATTLVGLVGWRGMVGSVLMDRMQAEGDFALIEPVFFSTSNAGGKAPAIVLDDADVTDVAACLRAASYWNAGQDCSAASRVLATPGVYEALLEALTAEASTLRAGDPREPDVELGPMTFERHRDRVLGHLSRAEAAGATVHLGGSAPEGSGWFIDRKSTRLNSSHIPLSRMPSSA